MVLHLEKRCNYRPCADDKLFLPACQGFPSRHSSAPVVRALLPHNSKWLQWWQWWWSNDVMMITWKWDDHMMKRLWSPLPCVQYYPAIQIVGTSLFVHFLCKFESFVGSTLQLQIIGSTVSCALCTVQLQIMGSTLQLQVVGRTVQRVISVPQTTLNSTCLRKVCIMYKYI